MAGLRDKIKDTRIGLKGKTPDSFSLGPNSTLHNTTSVDGNPAFGTYKDPRLHRLAKTKLAPKTPPRGTPTKYLDNPPR